MKIKKLKMLVSVGLALAIMLFGINASVYADNSHGKTGTRTETSNIYSSEGDLIGSVVRTHEVVVVDEEGGTRTTVKTINDYTLLPELQNDTNYSSIFKDEIKLTDIYYDNLNKKILVNGEELNVEEMESSALVISPRSDTAGFPAICHYYSTNDLSSYTFKSYQSMNYNWVGEGNGHGEPEGSHVTKTGITASNEWFAVAKNGVDLFDSSYSSFRQSYAALLAEAAVIGGIGAVFSWTGVAYVAAAGPLAIQAGIVIAEFNSAKSDLEKAYTYITKL